MAVKILSKTERLGLLQQSKASNHWSAPQAAGANFYTLNWMNAGTLNPNPDVQVDTFNNTSGYGTHFENERFFVDDLSGLPTIPFSGVCDKNEMAPILVSAMQAVSEAVGTPYEKTITAAGLTAPVDWAANGGYLFTVALDQGGSADDGVLLENAIINNLNLTWDLNARGIARLVNMSGNWVGKTLRYEQTLNGSWTNGTVTQNFFNNSDAWSTTFSTALLTIGGVDYSAECIRRVEVQINNNITSNCKTTAGAANQYDWAPEYKVMVMLDYNETTEKILYDFVQGVTASMFWSNDAADAGTDGKWSFSFPMLRIVSPPKTYNGDFLGVNLEFRAYSAAGATPFTMYYTDTIDWGF